MSRDKEDSATSVLMHRQADGIVVCDEAAGCTHCAAINACGGVPDQVVMVVRVTQAVQGGGTVDGYLADALGVPPAAVAPETEATIRKAARIGFTRPVDIPDVLIEHVLGMTHRSFVGAIRVTSRWLRCTSVPPSSSARLVDPGHAPREYAGPQPAVITLVETVTLPRRCLLARHRASKTGGYSLLAGSVEIGESLEDAVRREIFEEAGVVLGDVSYAGSQPWPFPAGLMVGFRAAAKHESLSVDGNKIQEAAGSRETSCGITARLQTG